LLRYLTVPRLGVACHKSGPGERTPFHRSGVGPTPLGCTNGMSQASRSFLDISERFRSHPGERTPLHRSGVGPAPPGWTKDVNLQTISCHFLRHRDVSSTFRTAGVFLQFSGQQGYPCNFPWAGHMCNLIHMQKRFVLGGPLRNFTQVMPTWGLHIFLEGQTSSPKVGGFISQPKVLFQPKNQVLFFKALAPYL
ncbi:hypothetical protein Taro_004423, partial [Colocasia esculenta]|nr:hypothetical protein [Colocasia esculenta]